MHWLHFGDIESNLDQYFQGHLIYGGFQVKELMKC